MTDPQANCSPTEEERKPPKDIVDEELPENSKEKLDHAIEETFPTSDPISVKITK